MTVREMKGNDFNQGKCSYCGAPRRLLFAVSRGGGKNTRTQGTKFRKCRNGHRSAK